MNKPILNILKEQGFCFGVSRAIKIALDSLNDTSIKKPIYLLGNIVHNHYIKEQLESLGIIILEGKSRYDMLDEVPTNATVMFSAHGVSDEVKAKAINKNLHIIDSTCPYVEKTFDLVKEYANNSYILYIGKSNHPETEAVKSLSNNVYLVNNHEFNKELDKDYPLYIAHQTTMSSFDIKTDEKLIKDVYPNAFVLDMICKVTEKRQRELTKALEDVDDKTLVIVVGDKTSNNSTKLYELSSRSKATSIFIESYLDLDTASLFNYSNIIIASGTSTPSFIIDKVIDTIKLKLGIS